MQTGVDGLVQERDEDAMRKRITPKLSAYELYAKKAKNTFGVLAKANPMTRDLLRVNLDKAGLTGISVDEYVAFYNAAAMIGFVSTLIFLGVLFFSGLLPEIDLIPLPMRILLIFPLSISVALVLLYFVKSYPANQHSRIIEETERELPDFLRAVALEQTMKVKIEESLENIADEDYGPISKIIGTVLRKTRAGGQSLSEALKDVANDTDSDDLATSFKQLAIAVESGANIEAPLWNLSKNADSTLINKLRSYSGKLKGLVAFYITASTVFPAMLGALLVVVASTGMAPIPIPMFYFLFGLVFPGLNAVIIYYMISSEPLI